MCRVRSGFCAGERTGGAQQHRRGVGTARHGRSVFLVLNKSGLRRGRKMMEVVQGAVAPAAARRPSAAFRLPVPDPRPALQQQHFRSPLRRCAACTRTVDPGFVDDGDDPISACIRRYSALILCWLYLWRNGEPTLIFSASASNFADAARRVMPCHQPSQLRARNVALLTVLSAVRLDLFVVFRRSVLLQSHWW